MTFEVTLKHIAFKLNLLWLFVAQILNFFWLFSIPISGHIASLIIRIDHIKKAIEFNQQPVRPVDRFDAVRSPLRDELRREYGSRARRHVLGHRRRRPVNALQL